MAKLRYDGPPDHALAGVGALTPGETYDLDDDAAEQLAGAPWWTPVGWTPKEPDKPKLPKTHAELDELAAQHGLEYDDDLTVAEKQEQLEPLIERAESSP